MKFMLITNDVELARHASRVGVGRVFIDLEANGKYERQGHLDTFISQHSFSDIPIIRKSISGAALLVRLNPLHADSEQEVESAINFGADLLMLPMFKTSEELAEFSNLVGGRVGIIPLVETHSAMLDMGNIVKVPGLSEVFIGLNDLHLDMGLKFMFEPLANGMLEKAFEVVKDSGLPFGFGGVARVGEGLIPGELVLAEHVRLGSSSVILSRTFNRGEDRLPDSEDIDSLESELRKLNLALDRLKARDAEETEFDRVKLQTLVRQIVGNKSL